MRQLTAYKGTGIAIIGAQFGDEGKGKIVDTLAEKADLVVRYQGGANAGHTIKHAGKEFILHLLPSGVVRKKRSLIGAGVVLDPHQLMRELEQFQAQGTQITPQILGISPATHIVLPWYQQLDQASATSKAIGTTGKGIGQAYQMKSARVGLQFEELLQSKEHLQKRLEQITGHLKTQESHSLALQPLQSVLQELLNLSPKLKPYLTDVSLEVHQALLEGKTVIFESAQGTHLDLDHGTYPDLTSSNPVTGGALTGIGIGPQAITQVHLVAKAYTTRVGSGPFPTELFDETGNLIRETGKEYGATTGRPRRTGWLDLPMLKTSARLNGATSIHLTKADILAGIGPMKIAESYTLPNGKTTQEFPITKTYLQAATPNYKELPALPAHTKEEWEAVTHKGKTEGFTALPHQLQTLVKLVEEHTQTPVASVSVGPGREDIIWAKN
jgi:adenylosuccinate synthase